MYAVAMCNHAKVCQQSTSRVHFDLVTHLAKTIALSLSELFSAYKISLRQHSLFERYKKSWSFMFKCNLMFFIRPVGGRQNRAAAPTFVSNKQKVCIIGFIYTAGFSLRQTCVTTPAFRAFNYVHFPLFTAAWLHRLQLDGGKQWAKEDPPPATTPSAQLFCQSTFSWKVPVHPWLLSCGCYLGCYCSKQHAASSELLFRSCRSTHGFVLF